MRGQLQRAHELFQSIPQSERKREDIALGQALVLYQKGEYKQTLSVLKKQKIGYLPALKRSALKLKELAKTRLEEAELAAEKAALLAKRQKQVTKAKDGDHAQ